MADLDDIAEYIALNNPAAARDLVRKVFDKVARLADHPESGRLPLELYLPNYREVIVNPCRIFYKLNDGNPYILFVCRQEQDLRRFILDKGI